MILSPSDLPFYIRKKIRWFGLRYQEESLRDTWAPPTERAQALFARYHLQRWAKDFSEETFREIFGILDLLDRVDVLVPSCAQVLDVGAKNWRYLGAIVSWLMLKASPLNGVELSGVELDAYRIYPNLRTRRSFAEYFTRVCSVPPQFTCHYYAMDALEWARPVDLVTWFFPFVLPAPHRQWGLPRSLFRPQSLFDHVISLLRPGGSLVMANQGEWEWIEAQKQIHSLRLRKMEKVEGSLHSSAYPIFLSVWTREA